MMMGYRIESAISINAISQSQLADEKESKLYKPISKLAYYHTPKACRRLYKVYYSISFHKFYMGWIDVY
jgi:hypothetical protein